MKNVLLLLGGTALALAVFAVINSPQFAPADAVDDFGNRLTGWGTKQRVAGAGGRLQGKVEQAASKLTGDPDLADEGVLDEASSNLQDAAGHAAQALGNTVRDLNS